MNDTGLLRRHSNLAPSVFTEGSRLFTEFKGALTENYVLQELAHLYESKTYYWSESPYEVDFVIQHDNNVVPVEVKAGENVKAVSLKNYMNDYAEATPVAIRFSLKNLSYGGKVLNIPLYLADEADRLLSLALSS